MLNQIKLKWQNIAGTKNPREDHTCNDDIHKDDDCLDGLQKKLACLNLNAKTQSTFCHIEVANNEEDVILKTADKKKSHKMNITREDTKIDYDNDGEENPRFNGTSCKVIENDSFKLNSNILLASDDSQKKFNTFPTICSFLTICCCPCCCMCSHAALVYSTCAYTDFKHADMVNYRRKNMISCMLSLTQLICLSLFLIIMCLSLYFLLPIILQRFRSIFEKKQNDLLQVARQIAGSFMENLNGNIGRNNKHPFLEEILPFFER